MNRQCFSILAIFSLIGISACLDELEDPGYSEVPYIEIEEADIILGEESPFDTIKITVYYRDGDSDLGLDSEDDEPPFHYHNFPKDINGNYIKFDSEKDTFNCQEFMALNEYDPEKDSDTVRYTNNKYSFNFRVDLLVKEGDLYKKHDFFEENCSLGYGGRFPRIDPARRGYIEDRGSAFTIYQINRWEGKIIYEVPDLLSRPFRQKEVKFRIQIYDRALHESNVVETKSFIIED